MSACPNCRSNTASNSPSPTVRTPPAASASRRKLPKNSSSLGIDVITTGNHVWDKREIIEYMNSANGNETSLARRLLRPANYPAGSPGSAGTRDARAAAWLTRVINLQGRVFMANNDDPVPRRG